MPRGSRRYRDLTIRLSHLRTHCLSFLPDPPTPRIGYTDVELDLTRAYMVLCHAEIEAFCEQIVLDRVQTAKAVYDNTGGVRPTLRRIITHYVLKKGRSWTQILYPPVEIADSAFNAYRGIVKDNHGVKRRNLEALLFPLGVQEVDLSPTWLAQMDSFGSNRGRVAHSSARLQTQLDPPTELRTVNQLLTGLLDLDRVVGQLR